MNLIKNVILHFLGHGKAIRDRKHSAHQRALRTRNKHHYWYTTPNLFLKVAQGYRFSITFYTSRSYYVVIWYRAHTRFLQVHPFRAPQVARGHTARALFFPFPNYDGTHAFMLIAEELGLCSLCVSLADPCLSIIAHAGRDKLCTVYITWYPNLTEILCVTVVGTHNRGCSPKQSI